MKTKVKLLYLTIIEIYLDSKFLISVFSKKIKPNILGSTFFKILLNILFTETQIKKLNSCTEINRTLLFKLCYFIKIN